MKIEKLTENKIRIIVNSNDIGTELCDLNEFLEQKVQSNQLFYNILLKAEKEHGFDANGCKLLIETVSCVDDSFILMITRLPLNNKTISKSKHNDIIYSFKSFDEVCSFCNYFKNVNILNISKILKNSSLYLYNDTYYLIISNYKNEDIHTDYKSFFLSLSEFDTPLEYSDLFKYKLIEHGEIIIDKNAIFSCVKYYK